MAGGQVFGGAQQRYQGVQPPAPQQDSTIQTLFKMAQPIIEKKIEQEQEKAFTQGMQRVALGEAYKDVKSGDSLLNKIFGPSATVQGAAAMAKVKGVDDFATQMYQDMQGNASMSPDQFRDHAAQSMNQFLTGDVSVDSAIQAKMVESLPTLMKAQAKANYAWVQQQNINQYNGMLQAAGDKFAGVAKQYSQKLLSKEDFGQAQLDFMRSVQPVAGMNPEAYKKAIMDSSVLAMNRGNLWVDRVFQQSGMYSMLDVDDQKKMMDARSAAQTKVQQEYGFNQYGAAIGELVGGAAGRSPAQNHAMANALNQRYMDETGSEVGILNLKDMIGMDRSVYSRLYAQQDKFAELNYKAQLDARAEGRLAQQSMQMMQAGAGNYTVGAGVPKAKVDITFSNMFDSKVQAGKENEALDMATDNYSHGNAYINPQLEGLLKEPFRMVSVGSVPGPEFDRAITLLDKWEAQPNSSPAIDAYLGAENRVALTRYRQALVALNGDKIGAAKAAWGQPVTKGPSLTNEDMLPLMLKGIADKFNGKTVAERASNWLNNVPGLDAQGQQVVLDAVKQDATIYMNNLGLPPQAALARALDGPGRQKIDVIGQYAYTKQPNQLPLAAMVGTDDQSLAKLMPSFLQSKARDQGVAVNLDNAKAPAYGVAPGAATATTNVADLTNAFGFGKAQVSLIRSGDGVGADGKPYAIFVGHLFRDEKSATVTFTSKDLKAFYEKQVKSRNDLPNILGPTGL